MGLEKHRRGFRPDARPLGHRARPLSCVPIFGSSNVRDAIGIFGVDRFRDLNFWIDKPAARVHASWPCASSTSRPNCCRREPHARRGGARPLRAPSRRLSAAPAQPDLRRQSAARAGPRRRRLPAEAAPAQPAGRALRPMLPQSRQRPPPAVHQPAIRTLSLRSRENDRPRRTRRPLRGGQALPSVRNRLREHHAMLQTASSACDRGRCVLACRAAHAAADTRPRPMCWCVT